MDKVLNETYGSAKTTASGLRYITELEGNGASPKATDSQVGTIKFKDVNGDGVITFGGDHDDRTVIGNPFPKALIGMTNTFNYRNFDLTSLKGKAHLKYIYKFCLTIR